MNRSEFTQSYIAALAARRSSIVIKDVIYQEAMKGYTGFTVEAFDRSELHGIRRGFLYHAIVDNKESLEKAGFKVLMKTHNDGPKTKELSLIWGREPLEYVKIICPDARIVDRKEVL